jgi:hypothetical protein
MPNSSRKPLAPATRYRKIKVGDLVQLKRELRNGAGEIFAEGLVMRVWSKRGGLHLQTINDTPCPTCGLGKQRGINRVQMWDVEEGKL